MSHAILGFFPPLSRPLPLFGPSFCGRLFAETRTGLRLFLLPFPVVSARQRTATTESFPCGLAMPKKGASSLSLLCVMSEAASVHGLLATYRQA